MKPPWRVLKQHTSTPHPTRISKMGARRLSSTARIAGTEPPPSVGFGGSRGSLGHPDSKCDPRRPKSRTHGKPASSVRSLNMFGNNNFCEANVGVTSPSRFLSVLSLHGCSRGITESGPTQCSTTATRKGFQTPIRNPSAS